MRVEQTGEFGIIDRIKRSVITDGAVIKGIGDDCAVIDAGGAGYTLLTCDMIVEGIDFRPKEKLNLVGRKALGISLSDIAACGGIPRYALVSLGLPARFSVKGVDEIYRGMGKLAKEFGVNIVGGDLSKTPRLTIDLSLYGNVEREKLVLREGARENDVIFVTGSFGGSIRRKHLAFTPRVREARYLVDNFKPHAMIDCSDGLAADLGHILDASTAGCVLFEHLIPRSKDSTGIRDALYSGEDFELIFTLGQEESDQLIKDLKYDFYPIGTVTSPRLGRRIIDENGKVRKLEIKGYRHF